jgi:DNA-directed RNA polymerase subunit RPC12/RpoP
LEKFKFGALDLNPISSDLLEIFGGVIGDRMYVGWHCTGCGIIFHADQLETEQAASDPAACPNCTKVALPMKNRVEVMALFQPNERPY